MMNFFNGGVTHPLLTIRTSGDIIVRCEKDQSFLAEVEKHSQGLTTVDIVKTSKSLLRVTEILRIAHAATFGFSCKGVNL